MMAPSTVVDNVMAHELCHVKNRDRSEAFWNAVDKVLPSFREQKVWPRRNGGCPRYLK